MMRAWELRWSNSETRAKNLSTTPANTRMAIRAGILGNSLFRVPFHPYFDAFLLDFHFRLKQRGTQPHSRRSQAFRKLRPDSGGAESSSNLPVLIQASALKNKNILHGEKVSVHARDLGYGDDLARAVSEARDLHHGMHSRSDLVTNSALW